MTSTTDLLDQAKAASGCESDYQFAKRFGLKIGTVSTWRTGRYKLDDKHAALIAGIIGREPGEVMALCAAERSKDTETKARWLRVAALLAAAVLPPAAGASVDNNQSKLDVYAKQNANYAKWQRWLALLAIPVPA